MQNVITEWEAEKLFTESLDEWSNNVKLFGSEYLPSEVLKKIDPIKFREMFLNYIDQEKLIVEGY